MKTTINIASTQSNTKTFALSHLVAGALLSIVLVSAVSAQQRMLLDKIVAIVDRDVVLQSELVGRLNDVRGTATRDVTLSLKDGCF